MQPFATSLNHDRTILALNEHSEPETGNPTPDRDPTRRRRQKTQTKNPRQPDTAASISINQRARRATGSGQIALTPRAGVLTASSKSKGGEKICPPLCHNAPQLWGQCPVFLTAYTEKGRAATSKARNAHASWRGGQTMTHRQQQHHHRQPP